MFRYRVYTEAKNEARLNELIGDDFKGYTVLKSLGVYNGKVENALVFEIVTGDASALSCIKQICNIIREENKQECVLVTRDEVESFVF